MPAARAEDTADESIPALDLETPALGSGRRLILATAYNYAIGFGATFS